MKVWNKSIYVLQEMFYQNFLVLWYLILLMINLILFFQPQFIFNSILYQFWAYNIVVIPSGTLQSGPLNISSTHLTPYIVITILLTMFPMLQFTSCNNSVTTNLYFLTSSLTPQPPPTSLFSVSMRLFLCSVFCSLDLRYNEIIWSLSFSI